MSFLQKIIPGAVTRAVLKGLGVNWVSDYSLSMGGPSWISNKGDAYIKQGFMMNPLIYAIITYKTRLASGIPWILYQVKEDKYLNRYKQYNPLDPIREGITRIKGLDEISSHKIYDVWKRPNPLQGQYEFVEQMYGFKELLGNTYVHGYGPETGPNGGQFHEMRVLPAQDWRIQYGSAQDPVAFYYPQSDPGKKIPPEAIMHSKYWNPLPIEQGGLYGLSPIQAGSRTVTRSNDGITASTKSLQNMGAQGILSSYAMKTGVQDFTTEQAQDIKDQYYEEYGGPLKRGKIVVTSAPVKWQQIGLSPVDLKILEQDKADLRHICNIYGLQSQLFNDPENKTYANMDQAVLAAYTHAVIPGMRAIRDELNRWWVSKFETPGVKLWFDMDLQSIPELQENMIDLVGWLKDCTWLTGNEKRAVMNYGEYVHPDMDVPLIPDGVTPVDLIRMGTEGVDKYLRGEL